MEHRTKPVLNQKRRTALAFGITGIGAFIVGKLFGNDIVRLFGGETDVDVGRFENFKFTESRDEMILSDKSGDPIFIIDKASFKE